MSSLLINTITEMRAYGVGVIFSDQSPSRVGGQLLDNVDNIISFRLSGAEAEMLAKHTGSDENVARLLSQLNAGELVLKNRFINNVIPVRHESHESSLPGNHFNDEYIYRSQKDFIDSHSKEYCPYALCESAGCGYCKSGLRGLAKRRAVQLFVAYQNKLKDPKAIAQHIILLYKFLEEHKK